ncbi:MAG: two-component sensor histidine kinase [Planctomycetes bacterium]|nr:two-component sensor histidine kinase [Planctomycetota bacterium]
MGPIILAFVLGVVFATLVAWQLNVRWARVQQKKKRQLLERARRAEKLAELGTLTGGLAHELRNPLSAIRMNLQLLTEDIDHQIKQVKQVEPIEVPGFDSLEHVWRRYLRKIDTISNEADRLTETLNDFLRYAGRIELHPVRCDVNELLDDLIDFYEPQAQNLGVQIRRNLHQSSLFCRVDADILKQAFLNLFINAVQAMGQGGELIVGSRSEGSLAVIDVIDTGPGIAGEDQEKIFDAYFTTRPGGTGLGLPMCRRIIEEHNGDIHLHSEPGKGTNFTVILPMIEEGDK